MTSGGTRVEMDDGSVPRAAWGRLANRGGGHFLPTAARMCTGPLPSSFRLSVFPSFRLSVFPSFRLSARRRTWRGSRRRSCTRATSSSASTCPASARGNERGYREKERKGGCCATYTLRHIHSYIKRERKRDAVPHTFVHQNRNEREMLRHTHSYIKR